MNFELSPHYTKASIPAKFHNNQPIFTPVILLGTSFRRLSERKIRRHFVSLQSRTFIFSELAYTNKRTVAYNFHKNPNIVVEVRNFGSSKIGRNFEFLKDTISKLIQSRQIIKIKNSA